MPPPRHAGRSANGIVKGMPIARVSTTYTYSLPASYPIAVTAAVRGGGLGENPPYTIYGKFLFPSTNPNLPSPSHSSALRKCTNAPGSCGSGALVYHLGRGSISQKRTHLFDNSDGLNRNQSTTCWISTNSLCSRGYLIAACAAASRARGTRKGLQDT